MENNFYIHNAGLVLLNGYFPSLFKRLGLMEDSQFITDNAKFKAVQCLQYLATEESFTEEHYLVLNKLLCGVNLQTSLITEVTISEADKETMNSLLEAAISLWPSISHSSIDGFRGNWLVRDGVINEKSDYWKLTVEKKPYDILINQSPFSFSIIHFPWMEKPIQLDWSY